MESIFTWIKLARPFLELAYDAALLLSPSIAAELRIAIDAIERAANDPQASTIARGSAQIRAFGDNVIAALNNLIADTTIDHSEKQHQATKLAASLNDSTKVYQAKHGEDAQLLADYKAQAATLVNLIINS
jgi:hypothetical protein